MTQKIIERYGIRLIAESVKYETYREKSPCLCGECECRKTQPTTRRSWRLIRESDGLEVLEAWHPLSKRPFPRPMHRTLKALESALDDIPPQSWMLVMMTLDNRARRITNKKPGT